jgi:hypothetical protein
LENPAKLNGIARLLFGRPVAYNHFGEFVTIISAAFDRGPQQKCKITDVMYVINTSQYSRPKVRQ